LGTAMVLVGGVTDEISNGKPLKPPLRFRQVGKFIGGEIGFWVNHDRDRQELVKNKVVEE